MDWNSPLLENSLSSSYSKNSKCFPKHLKINILKGRLQDIHLKDSISTVISWPQLNLLSNMLIAFRMQGHSGVLNVLVSAEYEEVMELFEAAKVKQRLM